MYQNFKCHLVIVFTGDEKKRAKLEVLLFRHKAVHEKGKFFTKLLRERHEQIIKIDNVQDQII